MRSRIRDRTLWLGWVTACAILALLALPLLPFLVRNPPEVVRQVWSFVGVHRVEWHAAELRPAGSGGRGVPRARRPDDDLLERGSRFHPAHPRSERGRRC